MEKLVLGVAATRRDVFDAKEAQRYKDIVLKEIKGYGIAEIVDIDDINPEGLLFDENDLCAIEKKFRAAGVNGLFFPHGNFGTEFLVGKLAKRMGLPVLIWGPRDDAPGEGGVRSRDSQCGLFASGKVLRRFGVPFTYITNCHVTDEEFKKGFANFIAVCGIVKAFRNIKILQISTRPAPFWTMIVNEGELLERYGIEVFPITLTEMLMGMEDIKKESGQDFKDAVAKISKFDCATLEGTDGIANIAAMKVWIKRTAEQNGCNAVCMQCWTALQDAINLMPCAANGLLADEGLPTMCETDIHGCVSSLVLQAAVEYTSPIFFADLTVRHPENDNAELLWHCGNFPPSCAKDPDKASIGINFVLESHAPGIGNFELRHDDITVCRFDGDNGEYSMFMGEGKAVDGPMTSGTYVWMEVPDWKKWEHKLVTGPYVHHCAGAYGKVAVAMYEACKYIGVTPDPADPTREEIEYQLIHGLD